MIPVGDAAGVEADGTPGDEEEEKEGVELIRSRPLPVDRLRFIKPEDQRRSVNVIVRSTRHQILWLAAAAGGVTVARRRRLLLLQSLLLLPPRSLMLNSDHRLL